MNATAGLDGRPQGQGWGEDAEQAGMASRRKAREGRRPRLGQYPHPAFSMEVT